jgi:hypothetical protein
LLRLMMSVIAVGVGERPGAYPAGAIFKLVGWLHITQ